MLEQRSQVPLGVQSELQLGDLRADRRVGRLEMVYHGRMWRNQRGNTELAIKLREIVSIVRNLAEDHRRLYKHRPDRISRDTMSQLNKLESEVLKVARAVSGEEQPDD